MSRFSNILLICVCATVMASTVYLSPLGLMLEEWGLDGLFLLRGQRASPPSVAVVSLEHRSAEALGVPRDPGRWPRDLHAQLIDILSQAGAAAIVFDVHFNEPRDGEEDQHLARAVRQAANVVLFARLARDFSASSQGWITQDSLELPAPQIVQAPPAAIAPFALPDTGRVRYFWSFHPAAGGLPTLPAAALQVYAGDECAALQAYLRQRYPTEYAASSSQEVLAVSDRAISTRTLLRRHPERLAQIRQDLMASGHLSAQRLEALLGLYTGGSPAYLNFYGPPRTVRTMAFYEVLRKDPALLKAIKGRAVLVGFSAERQPDEQDVFNTVFRESGGLDISGVEIAATALANLIEGRLIEPLSAPRLFLVILLYSAAMVMITQFRRAGFIIVGALVLAIAYVVLAAYLFSTYDIWLPYVFLVALLTPALVFASMLLRYAEARQAQGHMRRAFNFYLPEPVVDQLEKGPNALPVDDAVRFGICLATDAEQYTPLAENMAPDQLSHYMNDYYEVLFAPVRARGGRVFDVVGDAMLAIWAADAPHADLKTAACEAACDILNLTRAVVREDQLPFLPTRIGLHVGELVTTNIGAADRYEYRAVGDVVNTAARIQSLNKQLGTRVIVSQEVLVGTRLFATRELGRFLLKGKRQPVTLLELLGRLEEVDARRYQLAMRFALGLQAFREACWRDAERLFQAIYDEFESDGPAGFYRDLCSHYQQSPPPDSACDVVVVDEK